MQSEAAKTPEVNVFSDAQSNIPATETQNSDRILKISPRAKNRAEKTGVDLRFATPTGPEGRIIEKDIITLEQSGPKATYAAKDQINDNLLKQGTGIGNRITTEDIQSQPIQSQNLRKRKIHIRIMKMLRLQI